MRRILRILLLPLVGIAVGAFILELYLRATGSYSTSQTTTETGPENIILETPNGKRLKPNSNVTIHNAFPSGATVHMETNSLGFRDRELVNPKPDGEIRILALGDSITWANYLEAQESFVEKGEHYLNKEPDGKHYEIINAGVGDIGLSEEIAILKEQGLKTKPDIVLLNFYLNDSRPPWGFTGEIGHRGWLRRHSVLVETIYRNLTLKQWIKKKGLERNGWYNNQFSLDWKHDPGAILKLAATADVDWGTAWQPDSWIVVQTYLDELKSLAEAHQFRVVVMAFPVSFQVYADYLEDTPQRTMKAEAEKRGFSYLDLLPVLRQHQDTSLFFDHAHPNEAGNDIIGKTLADFLISHD